MLKYKSDEDSSDDDDMAYLISRFQKIVMKNKIYKRGTNGTWYLVILATSVENLGTSSESVL